MRPKINEHLLLYVKISPTGKVHMAHKGVTGGYTVFHHQSNEHVPEREVFILKCNYVTHELDNPLLISVDGPATCLHCLKAAGLVKPKESDVRYVLYDKKHKGYYKKRRYRYRTVDHMFSATLYKDKRAVVRAGEVVRHYDNDGNQVSHEKYTAELKKARETGEEMPNYKWRHEFNNDRYDIKTISLKVESTSR